MTPETKQFMLEQLRSDYIALMQKLIKIPGAPMQKQQAFLRFDEGHMWLQNAIASYVEPQPQPAAIAQPESPEALAVPVNPDEVKPQEEEVKAQ